MSWFSDLFGSITDTVGGLVHSLAPGAQVPGAQDAVRQGLDKGLQEHPREFQQWLSTLPPQEAKQIHIQNGHVTGVDFQFDFSHAPGWMQAAIVGTGVATGIVGGGAALSGGAGAAPGASLSGGLGPASAAGSGGTGATIAGAGGTAAAHGGLSALYPQFASGVLQTIGAVNSAGAARDAAQIQADAANRAADLNASATDKSLAFQQQQWAQTQANQRPYLDLGFGALGKLATGLGLPQPTRPTYQPMPMSGGTFNSLSAPAQAPQGPPQGQGVVTMRAPTGETQQVPAAQVAHYTSLGATVVN